MGSFDNYDPVKALSAAVISQAALDYQELCDKGVSKIESYHGNYSKSEIVRFFRSDAAKVLLKAIGGHYTGNQIISMLKDNEAANGKKKRYTEHLLSRENSYSHSIHLMSVLSSLVKNHQVTFLNVVTEKIREKRQADMFGVIYKK